MPRFDRPGAPVGQRIDIERARCGPADAHDYRGRLEVATGSGTMPRLELKPAS